MSKPKPKTLPPNARALVEVEAAIDKRLGQLKLAHDFGLEQPSEPLEFLAQIVALVKEKQEELTKRKRKK